MAIKREKYTAEFRAQAVKKVEENKQLKRTLRIAEEEREILKKATSYFTKNN